MRYFIYACPSRYRNDENMHDFEIVENFSYEEALDRAISLGYETIENYMRPEEEIYTREDYVADIGADEWDDDYEEDNDDSNFANPFRNLVYERKDLVKEINKTKYMIEINIRDLKKLNDDSYNIDFEIYNFNIF